MPRSKRDSQSQKKPVVVTPQADRETDKLADYIAGKNPAAARKFLDALKATYALIGQTSGIGSKRFSYLPSMQNLRVTSVGGFTNHLVFYLDLPDRVIIVSLLHAARDIPPALRDIALFATDPAEKDAWIL